MDMNGKDVYFHVNALLKLQSWAWYLFFFLFGGATVLYALDIPVASRLIDIAVILIMVMALIVAFVMAEQFRRAKLYRYGLLGYVMIFISLCTLLIGWYL